jgi:hypothetical protein
LSTIGKAHVSDFNSDLIGDFETIEKKFVELSQAYDPEND